MALNWLQLIGVIGALQDDDSGFSNNIKQHAAHTMKGFVIVLFSITVVLVDKTTFDPNSGQL